MPASWEVYTDASADEATGEEQSNEEEVEQEEEQEAPPRRRHGQGRFAAPSSQPPSQPSRRVSASAQRIHLDRSEEQRDRRPGEKKREQTAPTTGRTASFPTLGLVRSRDPTLSMAWELHARLVVHKWKVLLLMLRARSAVGKAWKRNCQWLAGLLATETASIWGHLGSATRVLRGPKGPPLFK